MTITAKFAGKCACCGTAIAVGSKIEWAKGQGARHTACAAGSAATAAPARSRGYSRGYSRGNRYTSAEYVCTCRYCSSGNENECERG